MVNHGRTGEGGFRYVYRRTKKVVDLSSTQLPIQQNVAIQEEMIKKM